MKRTGADPMSPAKTVLPDSSSLAAGVLRSRGGGGGGAAAAAEVAAAPLPEPTNRDIMALVQHMIKQHERMSAERGAEIRSFFEGISRRPDDNQAPGLEEALAELRAGAADNTGIAGDRQPARVDAGHRRFQRDTPAETTMHFVSQWLRQLPSGPQAVDGGGARVYSPGSAPRRLAAPAGRRGTSRGPSTPHTKFTPSIRQAVPMRANLFPGHALLRGRASTAHAKSRQCLLATSTWRMLDDEPCILLTPGDASSGSALCIS